MVEGQLEDAELAASLISDLEGLNADYYEYLSKFVRAQKAARADVDDDIKRQTVKEIRNEALDDSFSQFSALLDKAITQIRKTGSTKYLVDLYKLAVEARQGPNFAKDRDAAEKRAFELLPLTNTFATLDQEIMDKWQKILRKYNLIDN